MKAIPLVILGVVSLLVSGAVFHFINDPEGPNLVVVIGLAAIIFAVSLAIYAGIRRYRKSTPIF